jgi:hypothetical protein
MEDEDIARNIEGYLKFHLHKKWWRDLTKLEKKLIESCLETRQDILNKNFVWTEEAKSGILRLNAALIEANALVNEEYDKRKSELEAREKSGDKFLTDYNIDKKITMMIETLNEEGEWEEPWDGIYDILNNYIGNDSVNASTIATIGDYSPDETPLNWNITLGIASEQFKDDFIHYGIHCLWDHTPLAWEDILKIRSLWTEVTVDYQRMTNLF